MSKKSEFQERLVSLFLRLNGYLQSGYIPHSEKWGDAGTDIDRIAIRFPNHSQKERGVKCYSDLDIPKKSIDIIIAEVKNSQVEFNETLRNIDNRAKDNWQQILNWIGLFDDEQIERLVPELILHVNKHGLVINSTFEKIETQSNFGAISIRPILFTIEKIKTSNDTQKWINGIEILQYIWDCFCPEVKRENCSTRYPFTLWGSEFKDIVEYIKARHKKGNGIGSLEEMYQELI